MNSEEANLREWIALFESDFENQAKISFVRSVTKAFLLLDKSSIWLFGLAGASSAVIISQLDMLTIYLSIQEIKLILTCLVISLLSGIAQRTIAFKNELSLKSVEFATENIKDLIETFRNEELEINKESVRKNLKLKPEMKLKSSIEQVLDFFPWPISSHFKRQLKKSLEDPTRQSRVLARATIRQLIWIFLQSVTFVSFVALTVTFIQL